MSTVRKSETCEEQLKRMVKDIAMSINSGEESAEKFMDNVYSIRYLVDQNKMFLGAELLVAGGGPTIWVDTFRERVTGWWGTDRVQWDYQDNIGLNDYCEEMYGY
tara:strand:- start:63 stop:377 length:315 start_codon:yes stop_codon:yes gene_type:complete